jgi:Lar family restriction alleviation protein
MTVCPFCGSNKLKPRSTLDDFDLEFAYVECLQCHAMGPEAESIEDAIQKWNRRFNPDFYDF